VIWVKGRRVTQGSRLFADFVAPADAVAVERLRRAGAVIVGMSNTSEFACKGLTTNRVYGTYLNEMTYFDARIERGNLLGNYATDDPAQATLLPQVTFEHVQDLAPGFGRAHLSGELLRVTRQADQTATYGGIPYVTGYEGTKQHLALEGAWEDQFILPGGLVATPYLGARLDATSYDRTLGAIPSLPAPALPYPTQFDSSLLSVTPIAAMDVRWPLVAKSGFDTHLVEPVAQLVYRGSSTTNVGITNDDAQSFVFDTSNLFTYNHFSGIDRQDTGLQANIGAHYLGNFADGSWIDLVAGQSFHLAGVNAFGASDAAQTGTSTGLGSAESYLVGSARAGFANGLTLAGKLQVDQSTPRITRAGAGASFTFANGLSTSGTYIYIAKDAALGTTVDQHEIQGAVGIPVADYWRLNGDLTWNLASNSWLRSDVGVTYDDGYLVLGAAETVVGLTDVFKPMTEKRGLYQVGDGTAPGLRSSSLGAVGTASPIGASRFASFGR